MFRVCLDSVLEHVGSSRPPRAHRVFSSESHCAKDCTVTSASTGTAAMAATQPRRCAPASPGLGAERARWPLPGFLGVTPGMTNLHKASR